MTLFEKIVLGLLGLAALVLFSVVKADHSVTIIPPPVAGEWSVVQGYIVTTPDGARMACEADTWTGDKSLYDFSCAPFVDPKGYYGNNVTGELTEK